MDKSCHSSGESTTSSNNNRDRDRDHYLKHLNKLSHKITKQPTNTTAPLIKKPTTFDHQNPNQPPQSQQNQNLQQPQPPPPPQQQQHQPPVYNINKNDFRDVVQKLTGSPAHDRISTPPPIHQPKPQSSRLQRIRPPPLAHLSNRPPSMLSCANPPVPNPNTAAAANRSFIQRPMAPLSPLPPFPSVHAAAESPVSAYLRFLQNSTSTADPNSKLQFSGFSPLAPLVSPRWNNFIATSQQQEMIPPPASLPQQFQLPSSPLPFGCLNSPRSSYPLLSPIPLFSPSSGQLNFPLSPTVPVPSPRWRGL